MKSLIDISTPAGVWLTEELSLVSGVLFEHLINKHPDVNTLCNELTTYKGKMLRPSLLLLSWRVLHPDTETPQSVRVAAGVVELIHLATLVHDDVLDEADLRRGARTINSLRGNEAAVMLGDYLLSSAFLLCSTIKNPDLNLLLGEVTNTLCAGEVVQLSNRNNMDLTQEQYFQIIRDKTASLIAASCEMGGVLGGGNEVQIRVLREFGERAGTAFQIKDDLLDLLEEEDLVGKPVGRDVEKGKLTLPVIVFLQENPHKKNVLLDAMSSGNTKTLREILHSAGSVRVAIERVNELVKSAVGGVTGEFEGPAVTQMCVMVGGLQTN
jgi:octaprenyl-diphosphate synthase